MVDASLDDLDDELYPLCLKWQAACAGIGLHVKVIVTWRSPEEQNAAKANGLSKAGAGDSPHNCTDDEGVPASCAFDFAVFDDTGKYIKNGKDPRYAQAGAIAKSLGLVWGGDFHNFQDFDHIELKNWRD
jgi:peptidoglycan L-alanyl-D-glutamate endopeptidase CwlK